VELGAGRSERLTYFAFDLLYVDGYDLRQSPLVARKGALQRIIEGAGGRFLYSQHLTEDGAKIHAKACAMGLEGVVSKLADSPYRSGRTDT
jgi:bifunctional non-homologous end joining protein LigD